MSHLDRRAAATPFTAEPGNPQARLQIIMAAAALRERRKTLTLGDDAMGVGEGPRGTPRAPQVLLRYHRRRGPTNPAMLAATDLLDRLFSSDNPLLAAGGDMVIAAVGRTPLLKPLFMGQRWGWARLRGRRVVSDRSALHGPFRSANT